MLADLHLHSTISDGWLEPGAVIDLAAREGVRMVALTDHDCLAGVAEARRAAFERGIVFVQGLELTTRPLFEMCHVLGHGVRPDEPALAALVERNQRFWRVQSDALLALLRERGADRSLDLASLRRRQLLMPNAVVRAVLDSGALGADEAWACVHRMQAELPAGVHAMLPTPIEAAGAIRAAGGLAVLAHPGVVSNQRLVEDAVPAVDGIEVHTRRHGPEQVERYRRLAERHGLLTAVGSDFHGYRGEPYERPRHELDGAYLDALVRASVPPAAPPPARTAPARRSPPGRS